MKIEDLEKYYDRLQEQYGATGYHAIYSGGCCNRPEVCFVFMNPTGRNKASLEEWKGGRFPWIGTKNIWKLFFRLGLLDEELFAEISKKKPSEWTESFAGLVYENVKHHQYFITNLGKCTQVDARALPDAVYRDYLDLLYQEIKIIKPKKIVTFGNQVSSIFLDRMINVSKCRKQMFIKKIGDTEYPVYPTYYPVGNGMRNMDLAVGDLLAILEQE